ncbi:MAG: serine/threonine-protein kinase [Candidatus Angelobacter sp.]
MPARDYERIRLLGRGGFGEVWGCRHPSHGTWVALKLLASRMDEDVRRFKREVRLLAQLNHPGIIKVLESCLEEETLCYAMPLYRCSLRERMPELMSHLERGNGIFKKVLQAMSYAHEAGVAHRDLKPENILYNDDEDIVISDFGLGRELDRTTTTLTLSGAGMGTIAYMAPEQMRDARRADARSDIFSLGIILREIYTGDFLPTHEAPNYPAAIEALVSRCTQFNPNSRFQSAGELLAAFDRLLYAPNNLNSAERLREIINTINLQGFASNEQLESMATSIAQCSDEADLLHEIATTMQTNIFLALSQSFPEIASLLVRGFAASCNRSFDFGYTDTIGATCRRLYHGSLNSETKAILVETAVVIGVSYNRWHVMEIAAKLVEQTKDQNDAVALFSRLEPLKQQLAAIEGYLKKENVHPIIRLLFDST